MAIAAALAWQGVLRTGAPRIASFALAGIAVVAALGALWATLLAYVALIGAGAAVTPAAVGAAFAHRGSAGGAWQRVPRSHRPVLLASRAAIPASRRRRCCRAGCAPSSRDSRASPPAAG